MAINVADYYPERSDDELKSIAIGLHSGEIFSHLQVDDSVHLAHIFIPLVYLTEESREFLTQNPPGLIYEYLSRAAKNVETIWRYPMFMSCNLLSKDQAARVYWFYDQLVEEHTTEFNPTDFGVNPQDTESKFESEYIFPG